LEINFLAIGLAALAGIIIGAVWFGPKTFFPLWWKFLGKNPSEQPGTDNMAVIFGSTFVAAVIQSIVMAVIVNLAEQATGTMDTVTGLAIGALVGVGFAATASLSHHLFGGFAIKAWVLEAGQDVVSLAAMGAIIASF
jgi:RsiW-degrading membrane proteinase PrsW (M82 family)